MTFGLLSFLLVRYRIPARGKIRIPIQHAAPPKTSAGCSSIFHWALVASTNHRVEFSQLTSHSTSRTYSPASSIFHSLMMVNRLPSESMGVQSVLQLLDSRASPVTSEPLIFNRLTFETSLEVTTAE